MDIHKESIDITVAEAGGQVLRWGRLGRDRAALIKAVRKLESLDKLLHFVFEAEPCGFWIERFSRPRGHNCGVVSSLLIPKKGEERIKTDRRDGENIARMARTGELAPVYVPDEAQRGLVRTRYDAIIGQRGARQRLKALLLRNMVRYAGESSWTAAFQPWLAELKLPRAAQQIAFHEYIDAVEVALKRVERLTRAMAQAAEVWRFVPVVAARRAVLACGDNRLRTGRLGALRVPAPTHGPPRLGTRGELQQQAAPPRAHHQEGQPLCSKGADRSDLSLSVSGAHVSHHRTAAKRIVHGRARHRLESAASPLRALQKAMRQAAEQEQGGGGYSA